MRLVHHPAATVRSLRTRIGGLFAPRRSIPDHQRLAAQLLNGLFLASVPIFLAAIVVRLALGIGLMEIANATLLALIAGGLLGALMLRWGRVYLSGFVLTFALWAAGTFMSWEYFGIRDATAFIPLFAVLIAFVVLPWRAGLLLTVLNGGSIWLYVAREVRSIHGPEVPPPVDAGLTFTAILILVSLLAFVFGQILRRAIRKTIAAQQALSSSEQELSSILHRTPDIIYRLDAEGRITYVNDAVRRYGCEPSQLVGRRPIDYVRPEDRAVARQCLDEGRADEPWTEALEVRLVPPGAAPGAGDGAALVAAEPVFLIQEECLYTEGAGPERLLGTQGIARDITDRKRVEDALRRSEEKYAKVFQAAPAGFIIATLEGARILDVNEEFERICGYRRDELIDHSALEIGLWVDPAERQRLVELLKGGGLAKDREVQGRAKNGEVRTVRYNAQHIDIGGTACLLSAVEDITERKRLELQLQQAQKLEAVGRLAGGIAHDFNNMITVIAGRAEMASRHLAPESPVSESIQEIRKAAERSSELTRQLLVFARGQSAAPRVLNLNDAISERLGMLQRLVGEGVELNWNPAPDLWPVKMDSVHVDQILVNLVANARDAMADVGALTISTENGPSDPSRPPQPGESPIEWVLMTLTDTGTGMSEETLAHIFEPFYTTKELGKGTGMGLATVYGIVQHTGGRIEVDSRLGVGTSFRISLPRTREAPAPEHKRDPHPPVPGRETVLVVDDERAILKFIRATLQQLGYTVIQAGSAKEALAHAARYRGALHLLLTDVVMPRMNGRDLYARIAAFHPEIRVVFMSGYPTPGETGSTGDEGSFLQKPFSMHRLSAKIREVLDQRRDAWQPGPGEPVEGNR